MTNLSISLTRCVKCPWRAIDWYETHLLLKLHRICRRSVCLLLNKRRTPQLIYLLDFRAQRRLTEENARALTSWFTENARALRRPSDVSRGAATSTTILSKQMLLAPDWLTEPIDPPCSYDIILIYIWCRMDRPVCMCVCVDFVKWMSGRWDNAFSAARARVISAFWRQFARHKQREAVTHSHITRDPTRYVCADVQWSYGDVCLLRRERHKLHGWANGMDAFKTKKVLKPEKNQKCSDN